MRLLYAVAALTLTTSAALGCGEPRDGHTIFVNDASNQVDANIPFVPKAIRFDAEGAKFAVEGGKSARYLNAGSAGTGIDIRLMYDVDDPKGDLVSYRFIDLSRIAKGPLNYALLFEGELFWPQCE